MTGFPLKIATPDGLIFDGTAEKLIVRTATGDMAILARHIDCVCPLGMGLAVVETTSQRRTAACMGGFLRVCDGEVSLLPTTWEWADQIEAERADASYRRAQAILEDPNATDTEIRLAQARLKRALLRKRASDARTHQ